MTPRARWLILGFALLGLGFASSSSWVHYRLLTDPNFISPCDLNSTFNCTQAYLSRFGSMFGVPVAILGAAWFGLVALIAAFARPDAPGGGDGASAGPAGSYVFGLSTVGLAMILYLASASWFQLKVFCLLCMGTYVSVIAIFIVSGMTTSVAMTRLPLRLAGDVQAIVRKPLTLVLALLYIAAAGSCVALFPREMRAAAEPVAPPPDVETRFQDIWDHQPRVDLGIPAGTAKVVVVKFNDWLCPGCKSMALAYQPVLDKYEKAEPGAVKYIVKDWPWNSNCNVKVPQTFPGHEGSCDAAVAVRIAREKSADLERAMVDWLLANQETLDEQGQAGQGAASRAIRAKAAELLGVKDFDREYAARLADIKRDVSDGAALQITSTPTYFVNGVRTTTPASATDRGGQNLTADLFDLGIKIELRKHGGTP